MHNNIFLKARKNVKSNLKHDTEYLSNTESYTDGCVQTLGYI